jgi:[ribosomal protein S18]-alanine N-acetyltransferase
MLTVKTFTPEQHPTLIEKASIIDFLYEHLEQYGDTKKDIEKCLNFALKIGTSFGGFILTSFLENTLCGVVIVNKTGMQGYIPENILVYIATHKDYRGQGIGKHLMQKAIENAEGDIALHVEPDNPARHLYTAYGFTNKYLEMRYKQK